MAQRLGVIHPGHDLGEVGGERPGTVLADQGGPGQPPVGGQFHRQRVPPQGPDPLADPDTGPVRQGGEIEVEGRSVIAGREAEAAERAEPFDLVQPAELRDHPGGPGRVADGTPAPGQIAGPATTPPPARSSLIAAADATTWLNRAGS